MASDLSTPTPSPVSTTFRAFFGGPGTGKTYRLKQMSQSGPCHIISPTWTNAALTGGETIFAWCGCNFLQPKPRRFTKTTVYVDEVFMFDKKTMQLILDCLLPNSTVFLFGDPFQVRQPTKETQGETYFYNAVYQNMPLREQMDVEQLDVYYRSANDPVLQTLLQSYRTSHRFLKSQLLTIIPRVNQPPPNSLTIVNTHRKEAVVQKRISIPAAERLHGQDGVIYRRNQRVFILRRHGAIERQGFIRSVYAEGAYVEIDGTEYLFKPHVSNGRMKYDFIRGDVVVINLVQGQEFDCPVCVCVDDFFEFGALYTALSRVKTLGQLSLLCDNEKEKVFETDLENYYT